MWNAYSDPDNVSQIHVFTLAGAVSSAARCSSNQIGSGKPSPLNDAGGAGGDGAAVRGKVQAP